MKTLQRILNEAPLIADSSLLAVAAGLNRAAETFKSLDLAQAAEHPQLKRLRDAVKPQAQHTEDGIAIVPVQGILARRPDVFEIVYMGMEDTAEIFNMIEAAANNPQVRGILLDVDSPGGFVTGGPEVADLIRQTGKTKPVVTWTGGMMASLAYWIGSQGGSVIASRSAHVGSIGAYMAHVDYSKVYEEMGIKIEVFKNKEADFKAAGYGGTSLTDAQRENYQSYIQAGFNEFRKAVKAARPGVEEESMRGQVFVGSGAKAAGLVDRVGDMSFALASLRSEIRKRK